MIVLKKVGDIFNICCKYWFFDHIIGVIGIALQAGRSRVWFSMVRLECFYLHNLPGCYMTLGSTRSLS